MRILILLILAMLTACTPRIIIKNGKPALTPFYDKAQCVIFNMNGNSDEFIPIYLDTKLVGGVEDSCMTAFYVDTGVHYLIATQDNESTLKLNFKARKKYFFRMGAIEVPMFDGVKMVLISDLEAMEHMNSGLVYKALNPERALPDFDEDDFRDEVEEYKEWADENPLDAKLEREYEGY